MPDAADSGARYCMLYVVMLGFLRELADRHLFARFITSRGVAHGPHALRSITGYMLKDSLGISEPALNCARRAE
jgi:hypothetical protein